MNYSEFATPFYNRTKLLSGIRGKSSQAAVGEFFLEIALGGDAGRFVYSQDAYRKWLTGENVPSSTYWNAIIEKIDIDSFTVELASKINDAVIDRLFDDFGVELSEGSKPDKTLFAHALGIQLKMIAEGQGEADNIVNKIYSEFVNPGKFKMYIKKATERYNVMKLLGGDEVPLEDFFVCNTLGEKPRVVMDKTQMRCKYIEDATIESIRDMYSDRKFYNRKTILIGSGGSGKTLMLQHLFLDAMIKYPKTGMLPIFLELRYFINSDDIESYIIKTVKLKDDTFTEEIANQLLLSGRCQILLDGLDEIDPSDINDFQKKLDAFTDKYSKTQVIIASRDCEAITGLHGYIKLYVWPFDNAQSEKLIDKILTATGNMEAKAKVLGYIDNGFIKKDGAFASHPMLLTYISINYPKFDEFYSNHRLFYKDVYDALLTGHDDNKKPYDRVFHSVDKAADFSKVFREFCGITYMQGVLEFDKASFDMYFSDLTSYKDFLNPHKMNAKSFKQDACATSCMMYEKELGILYIDPGFQEFLFAEYYSQQDTEKVKELGLALRNQSLNSYGKFDALAMLYDFTNEKVEVCIFLPFLDLIFKGKTEEENFSEFLVQGYDQVTYTVINEPLVEKYEKDHNVRRQIGVSSINEPRTIILSYILKMLGEPPSFTYLTTDSRAECEEFSEIALTGEYAYLNGTGEILYLRRNLQEQFSDLEKFEKIQDTSAFIRGEHNEILCFGHEYKIDSYDLEEEPDKFIGVIQTMMHESCDIHNTFQKLLEYYKTLKRKQRRNQYR